MTGLSAPELAAAALAESMARHPAGKGRAAEPAPFWCGTEGCTPPEGRIMPMDLADAVAERVAERLQAASDAYQLPAEVSAELRQFGAWYSRWQLGPGPSCYTIEVRPHLAAGGSLELVLLHGNRTELKRFTLAAGDAPA